jgi:hypothetical protein
MSVAFQQQQLQRQQQIAQIQKENQVFYEAYKTGKINYSEYSQAMNFQNQQLNQLNAGQAPLQPETQRTEFMGPVPPPSVVQAPKVVQSTPTSTATQPKTTLAAPWGITNIQAAQSKAAMSKATGEASTKISNFLTQNPIAKGQQIGSEMAKAEQQGIPGYIVSSAIKDAGLLAIGVNPPAAVVGGLLGLVIGQTMKTTGINQLLDGTQQQLDQIQKENQVFKEAYQSGKINYSEYSQATNFQNQRQKQLDQAADRGLLTANEAVDNFLGGAAFSVVGGKVTEGAGKAVGGIINRVAPSVAEVTSQGAGKVVSRVAGRAGVNAALSGGVSYAASGGDIEAAKKGAIFGAALSVALEPAGPLIAKASDRVFGTPARQLQGIKEVEFQTTQGQETVVTRFTQPKIESTRLSKSALDQYQKQASLARNIKMELAGTETVTTIAPNKNNILTRTTKSVTYEPRILKIEQSGLSARQGKIKINTEAKYDLLPETTTTKIPFETTRTAEPLIAAVKGETLYARKIGVGKVSDFLNTPSTGRAAESVKIKTTEVNLRQSSGNKVIDSIKGKFVKDQPSVVLEKTVITGQDAILPTSKTTVREVTGIKLTGELKPAENLKLDLKMSNAPKTVEEALGRTEIKQVKSTPMKQGTNEAFKKALAEVNLRKTDPEKYRLQKEAEIKGPTEKGLIASAIKNEIDDSINKVLSDIGVSKKDSPIWKDTPTTREIADKLSGASYGNSRSNAMAQGISKPTLNMPERVTIKSNIISVNPTKGSAWTGVASAAVWGSQQRQQNKSIVQSMGYTAQVSQTTPTQKVVQTVVPKLNIPQLTMPELSQPTRSAPSITQPAPNIVNQRTDLPTINIPITKGGPTRINTPSPIFDPPNDQTSKIGGGLIPVTVPKPVQGTTPKPILGSTPERGQPQDLIRIPDITTPATTQEIINLPKTSSVPKRKLQGLSIFPGGGSGGSDKMFSKRKGIWWKTKNPFPEPGQVFKQVLGTKSINVFKQTQAPRKRSSAKSNRRKR